MSMLTDLLDFFILEPLGIVPLAVQRAQQCPHGGYSTQRILWEKKLPNGVTQRRIEVTTTTRYGIDAVTEHTLEIK